TFTIVHTTAGVSGTFSGLPEGALIFADDGTPFTVDYQAGGGKDVVLTQVASPFAYDAASQTLTVTLDAPETGVAYSQATTQDAGGTLHTTYSVAVNNGSVSYTDAQVPHIVLAAHGAGDIVSLTTSDTYAGTDGQTHETAEAAVLGSGGGLLYRSGTPLVQMSGFTGVYTYMGRADYGLLEGTAGVTNAFVSAGSYAY